MITSNEQDLIAINSKFSILPYKIVDNREHNEDDIYGNLLSLSNTGTTMKNLSSNNHRASYITLKDWKDMVQLLYPDSMMEEIDTEDQDKYN